MRERDVRVNKCDFFVLRFGFLLFGWLGCDGQGLMLFSVYDA